MAVDNTILVRRGSGTPDYTDFAQYELAYDYTNDKLYIRDGNAMVEVGSAGGGATGDITAVTAGTGLDGGGTSGTVTLNIDSTVATLTGSQTLTNKTIASPTFTGDIAFNDASTPVFTIKDTTNNVQADWRATDTLSVIGTTTDNAFYLKQNGAFVVNINSSQIILNSSGEDRNTIIKDDSGTAVFKVDAGTSETEISTLLLDSVSVSGIQSSGESFADNDTSLMTSAAINDRIESFGYITTDTNTVTTNIAGTGVSVSSGTGNSTISIGQSVGTSDTVAFGRVNLGSTNNTTYLTGDSKLSIDGYIMAEAIVNTSETGSGPAAITFGDGATLGQDQISLVTGGARRLYVASNGNVTIAQDLAVNGTIGGSAIKDQDDMSSNSATHLATQQSIKAYVDAEVAGIVNSAPAALNTLDELAAALGDDANFATTTSTALGNRLRVDTASQGLTGTQQANAITNLGITATKAELNYVDGVTSAIQTQLDAKLTSSSSLNGSNISSGTVAAARIDNLAASKITSGVVSSARMPATFGADAATKDDITTRAESGFYQTASGTTGEGWPITNNSYQHMIASTHSNDSNYYSMQIAGSFYDQNFYGRKTNGSGTTSWLRFITTADEGSGNGFDADTLDGLHQSSFPRRGNLAENTASSITTFNSNAAINTSSGNQSGLQVYQATGGADAFMTFHVNGDYAVYFGLDGGTNDLAVGGWSRGANSYKVWHQGNDGSGSGLDADLLDGQQGSYYAQASKSNNKDYYSTANAAGSYLGGHYSSGGNEKPNSNTFGAGKLKHAMLSGSNLGFGGSWNDVIWVSSYTGGDVKSSHALVFDKYSTNVYVSDQNYDSTSWGTGYKLWHNGNDGSGSGLDADLLDGLQGSSYWTKSGSWAGDLTSNGWTRVQGVSSGGGEFVLALKNGQLSTLIDGSYFAYEAGTNQGGGFYSSSDSSYANATGIVASGGTLYVKQADGSNASLYSTGDLLCGSGFISGVGAADLQLRRTTNNDDRIVIEASETKIFGDAVERVRFGSYGIRNGYSGSVGTPSYSFIDDTDTGMYRLGVDDLGFSAGGVLRYGILNGLNRFYANVVVGPNNNNSKPYIQYKDGYDTASTPSYSWYYDNGCGIGHPAGSVIAFSTGSSERGRFTNSGLSVTGSISATADVVAYVSSDKRLKDNIKNIENPLEKLNKINGVEFDWNDKQDLYKGHDIGVIAQEVEEVLPEIVDTREDGHKAVKYDRMVALLIEAVKEQQQQINELKEKLNG